MFQLSSCTPTLVPYKKYIRNKTKFGLQRHNVVNATTFICNKILGAWFVILFNSDFFWHFQHDSVSSVTTAKLWECTFIAAEHRHVDKTETLPIKYLTLDLQAPTSGISICFWHSLAFTQNPELIWQCISVTYSYTMNVVFLKKFSMQLYYEVIQTLVVLDFHILHIPRWLD